MSTHSRVARRLLEGAAGAERDIAAWMAVEDHRHPAALAVQQRALIGSQIDDVSVDLAAAVQRVYTSVQDHRAEMAANTDMLARSIAEERQMLAELVAVQRRTQQMLAESAAEERRTRQMLAQNTAAQLRTQQMVAEFMTALRVSRMGDVRSRYPWGVDAESSPTLVRFDTPRLGGRLLNLGPRRVREARRAAAQKLLDAAGSDLHWALATRAQAARAETWHKLTGASNADERHR